ncbi:MAG: hypothetical protein NTW19_22850 [Planctomycetota bacterium]|nr:hypothetical protein [Planctomycetota bacterium]
MAQVPPPAPVLPPAPSTPDRRAGLRVFGVVFIILGCLAGCLVTCMPLSMFAARAAPQQQPAPHMTLAMLFGTMLFYMVIAAALIWTGVGTFKLRRWSRPIVLTIAWFWIVLGVATLAMLPMQARMMSATMESRASGGPQLPPGFVTGTIVVMAAFVAVLGIALPAGFLAFFMRKDVKAALEQYDPQPRWTDRCPAPVLGYVLSLLWGVMGMLMAAMMPVMPVFGSMLRQPFAFLVSAVVSAVLLYLAYEGYRQRPISWWGTIALTVVAAVNGVFVFANPEALKQIYVELEMPQEQIDALEKAGALSGNAYLPMAIFFLVAMVGYMIYIRPYFFGTKKTV